MCLPGFCHSSVIQIHRDSLHLSIIFSAPWCRIFPTTYSTLYWIKIWDMMLYVFRQITSLQKDMYIFIYMPPPETIRIKVLYFIFFHRITSLQKDIYLPPAQTLRIKVFEWVYSILSKIQGVQKDRFLRENLGSGRTRNLRQEPFHDFVGVSWKLQSFYPKKHRLRANLRICAKWWLDLYEDGGLWEMWWIFPDVRLLFDSGKAPIKLWIKQDLRSVYGQKFRSVT